MREKKNRIKEGYELSCLGGFECIYPLKKGVSEEQDYLSYVYDVVLQKSKDIYGDTLPGEQPCKKEEKSNSKPRYL